MIQFSPKTSKFVWVLSYVHHSSRENGLYRSSLLVLSKPLFWAVRREHQDIPYLLNKNTKKSKKPVISTLSGNGGVQIAAENRIDITTQNPLRAKPWGFESHRRYCGDYGQTPILICQLVTIWSRWQSLVLKKQRSKKFEFWRKLNGYSHSFLQIIRRFLEDWTLSTHPICSGLIFLLSSYALLQIACPVKVSYWCHDGCWNHSIFVSAKPCKYWLFSCGVLMVLCHAGWYRPR